MATRAFQQEVASWIVIDVEGQQSTNGWRARNDGEAKRVLAPELLLRQRFSWAQKVEAVDLRDQPKHRSSCSTLEEDFAAATVRLCPSALCKRPRAAGYRGSDFVLWHLCSVAASLQPRQLTVLHSPSATGPQDAKRWWGGRRPLPASKCH